MSSPQWRKIKTGSSYSGAKKPIALEVGEQQFLRSLAFALWLGIPCAAMAQNPALDEVIEFDIPQKRADLSLTEFAKQTNITLVFPFEEAMEVTTNELIGRYSIAEAAKHLVENTGLQVKIDEKGLLAITTNQSSEDINSMYNKNKLSSAIIGILSSSLVGTHALAQTPAAAGANEQVDEVMITGIRGSLIRAMDVKRNADGVVDAISSEDIGKFPDTNLAESLQRITGVSIDRSGGEGQLITVRGFGPEFNTVLVNGRQMATENLTRAFSFDTLASELVGGLDVHKTSTATMQSGGVGSTVNVKTARPFDSKGFKIAGSIKANYEENSEKTTPQFSGLVSDTFNDDTFGVLLSLSHQERKTRLNQAQLDGWLENVGIPKSELNGGAGVPEGTTVFSPRNYDTKVTFENRTRDNAALVLQYAPADNLTLTVDAIYSDFDVKTNALSYGHWFTAPNITDAKTDANGTVIDLRQEVGLATDMHSKKFDRLTETTLFGFNADWQASDKLNVKFDLSTSSAERAPNNGRGDQLSLIGYANRVRFQMDDKILPWASEFAEANPNIWSGQQQNFDHTAFLDPSDPNYEAPVGVGDFLDKSNSRAHVMLRRGWAVQDDVDQFKVDGTWDEGTGSGLNKIRFGGQYSSESKDLQRWDNEGVGIHCTFCGYPDYPPIPADMQYVFNAGKDFLSGVSGHGRMPTSWLAHDGEAQFAYLEKISGKNFDAVKRDNSFVVDENTYAFYLEADFSGTLNGMPVSATSGVRVESTDVSVDGTEATIKKLNILDQTEMLTEYGAARKVNADNSYDAILPNMSVKLDITDTMVLRAAASKTLTRPTLTSMAPVTVIGTTRQGGNLTSTSGNAELKPFESDNFDLSWEWYYGDASYVSAGYFKKNVSNFIVNTIVDKTFTVEGGGQLTDPSTGTNTAAPDAADTVAVFHNTQPNNGETATVDGLELGLQQTFESGFGFIVNATLVNSDADLDPADIKQTFALTGLSDSMNLVGFYEKGPVQIRLAYNKREEFVQSLTQSNGNGPTIVAPYKQFDLSASYDLTDNVTLFMEGINLTNEYVHKRGRYANQLLLIEDSGRRLALGLRANF